MGNDRRKAEAEFLEIEFGQMQGFVVSVRKIKCDGVGNVARVEVGAAIRATFDQTDTFFGFGERQSSSRAGWPTADNKIFKIKFPTHLYYFITILINISEIGVKFFQFFDNGGSEIAFGDDFLGVEVFFDSVESFFDEDFGGSGRDVESLGVDFEGFGEFTTVVDADGRRLM